MAQVRIYSYIDVGLIRCLNVDHASRAANTPVRIWTTEYPRPDSQSWECKGGSIEHGQWTGYIHSGLSRPGEPPLVLSVARQGSQIANGDTAVTSPMSTDREAQLNQMWVVEKVESRDRLEWGWYILHRETGLALDREPFGDRVSVWQNHGRSNQCWGMF